MSVRKRKVALSRSASRALSRHDELDQELRERLATFRTEWSLRELAEKLEISSVSVWKILQGQAMRPSTRRRVSQGLQALEVGIGRGHFDGLFRDLVRVLGDRRGNHLRKRIARLLVEAYQAEAKDLPNWLQQESRGAKSG